MEDHISKQLKKVFGSTDLYAIFEVSKTASEDEIRKSYKKLALKHHPGLANSTSWNFAPLSFYCCNFVKFTI
jgi:preprotein translocase subunit Sec63